MNARELLRRFPNCSRATLAANCGDADPIANMPSKGNKAVDTGSVTSQPERVPKETLAVVRGPQDGVGKRIIVRITCRRVRLQDPDNGLFKPLVDQLRYARLLPEDDHATIKLETDQIRVKTKKEEGTEVTLIYP